MLGFGLQNGFLQRRYQGLDVRLPGERFLLVRKLRDLN